MLKQRNFIFVPSWNSDQFSTIVKAVHMNILKPSLAKKAFPQSLISQKWKKTRALEQNSGPQLAKNLQQNVHEQHKRAWLSLGSKATNQKQGLWLFDQSARAKTDQWQTRNLHIKHSITFDWRHW